jgi:coenzyme F420-reducing hydrogenase alpha subunit
VSTDDPPGTYEIATGTVVPDAASGGGWVSLKEHLDTVRSADATLGAERDRRYREVSGERDQRYSEVKAAEEKALKVKETADLKALELASQIQTYKDEKANNLREQISSERGLYATREDLASALREINATIKPIAEYVASDRGQAHQRSESRLNANLVVGVAGLLLTAIIISVAIFVAAHGG